MHTVRDVLALDYNGNGILRCAMLFNTSFYKIDQIVYAYIFRNVDFTSWSLKDFHTFSMHFYEVSWGFLSYAILSWFWIVL